VIATFLALLLLAGTVLAAGVQQPAFAGDGDLIVGWMWTPPGELLADPDLNECRSLVSFRPDGSELTKIVDCNDNDEDIVSVQNIAVSPDGTRIAFTGETATRQALFVVGIDGEDLDEFCITDVTCEEETPDPFDSWGVQVSWESNNLLYVFFHNPGSRMLIVSPEDGIVDDIDLDGNIDTPGIRLSPDGGSLLFHDWDNVYLAPADDIEDFELLTPCQWPCHPIWHPSGEGVLYTAKVSGTDNYTISFAAVDPLADPFDYVLQEGHDIDGPNYGNQGPHSLAISPDGTRLVFGSWKNSGIYVVGIQSGEVLVVEDLEPIFTPFWTSHGNPRPSAGGFHWVGPATNPINPPDPRPAVSVSCGPLPLQVGATVTCTVTGGDPGIDILWRASYNPTFAGAGVTLDSGGTGSFTFTVPPGARGQEILVELVEWTAPMPMGVAGGPAPTRIPAGEGPDRSPALLLAGAGLALAFGVAVGRRGAPTVG
jgi:hypothetical protein